MQSHQTLKARVFRTRREIAFVVEKALHTVDFGRPGKLVE
jgi:hypothetical protein